MARRLAVLLLIGLLGCTATPADTPVQSLNPTPSPRPTRTPAPTPASATTLPATPSLAVNSWAEVVVDGLNLRERAGTGERSLGLLLAGSQGTIAAGPVEADGYTWYAMAGPGLPWGGDCPGPPDDGTIVCPIWFGWVASASTTGEAWVEAVALPCPPAPTTVAEAASVFPGVRLACFRGQTLGLDAYLSPVGAGRGCGAPRVTPAWLDDCFAAFLQGTATEIENQGPELIAYTHPDAGSCYFGGREPESCPFAPYFGQWVEVQGHVDDPAAGECEEHPPPGSAFIFDPDYLVYLCRAHFVVTAIEPAG